MSGTIMPQVVHDPLRLAVIVGKAQSFDREWRVVRCLLRLPIREDWLIEGDQPPRDVEYRWRGTTILLQMDDTIGMNLEIFLKVPEDLRIGAGPRIDRLLVVADGEDVPVILRQATNDRVLNRVQVLKLVDEHNIPTRADLDSDVVHPEELRRPQHESVEVGDVFVCHHSLISVVVPLVPMTECVAAEAIAREGVEDAVLHFSRNSEAAENGFLVWLVGDAEAWLEVYPFAELAQQLGAECVDRSSLHALYTIPELSLQTFRDLAGRLVGEGEDANSRRIDGEALDQESNALDQTEGLAGSRTGKDEQRLWCCFDCGALRSGRDG